jgi:hypothetical protein
MAWTRFAIAFDVHGDQQNAAAVKAFHRFCDDFKPQRKILGGDLWDFAALRRGASEEEKRTPLQPDYDKGVEFFERFQPDAAMLGNHCARLWRLAAQHSGPLSDYARQLVRDFDRLSRSVRCRALPYRKGDVLRLGPLNVVHGFFAGLDACRKHAAVYGPVVYGHVHTAEHCIVPHYPTRKEAWSAPCLARLDMEYAEATPATLRWVNGWIYGAFKGRKYHVETARIEDGSVMVPTGFRVLAA